MLRVQEIELRTHTTSPALPLIPRETLTDVTKANQLLEHANTQANELIRHAEEKCKALQETATTEIWQLINAQLKCWAHEREEIFDSLEHHVTLVTHQAITCILEETVEPKRLAALIRRLLACQLPDINPTLSCCPAEIEHIRQYLEAHNTVFWKLEADNATPPQTLILKTVEGDFYITWKSMLDHFLTPAAPPEKTFSAGHRASNNFV